jgi:hypothetical protein
MKSSRKLAVVIALGAAAFAGVRTLGCGTPGGGDEDPSLLFGRIWVEAKPDKPTDYVHGALLLPRPSIGLFHRSSAYDFHFERFDYKRDGNKVSVTFPQSGKKADIGFTIKACDALPPFDLCLDLDANPWGGPKRYYGMRRQDDEDSAVSSARTIRHELDEP